MIPSTKARFIIKHYEKLRLVGYRPTPDDVPTIGWGSTGPGIYVGLKWTKEQADARFDKDLARFADRVAVSLTGVPTTQDQFDAMVSLAYNIGIGAFRTSTLLKRHLAGNWQAAAEEFLRWDKQKGETLRGLTNRRTAERTLYLTGRLEFPS